MLPRLMQDKELLESILRPCVLHLQTAISTQEDEAA